VPKTASISKRVKLNEKEIRKKLNTQNEGVNYRQYNYYSNDQIREDQSNNGLMGDGSVIEPNYNDVSCYGGSQEDYEHLQVQRKKSLAKGSKSES
jgi:hypothetical protein